MAMITWEAFEKVELRIGTITEVKDFPEARKSAYQLNLLGLFSDGVTNRTYHQM